MDPFSMSASVIGIVAVALHSTRRVIEFIDGIQGAPEAVKALLRDLSALENVLQALNSVVSHPDFQANARRSELATLLQEPLNNCTLALDEISLVIRPYIKTSADPKISKWRSFKWSFREKEILTLQKMLSSYKTSLTVAVAVANLSTTSTGFSEWSKQMESLQQQLNDDSMSIANSSFLRSEAVGSDPGFALRRFLRESDSVIDAGGNSSPPTQMSFDFVVAVDVGFTETAVAYSAGPDWNSIEIIQHWPGVNGLASKVKTAISYDVKTDQISNWGFTVDVENPCHRIGQSFKEFMYSEYRGELPGRPTQGEARTWFSDFLSCIYRWIIRHFEETVPEWYTKDVLFVFSMPTRWNHPTMIAETKQLIRRAGFATKDGHEIEICLMEAEATAVYASKQQQYKDSDMLLVCDVGGYTTDINTLRVSNVGQTTSALRPLSCVEHQAMGSMLIDIMVEHLITDRLESIRHILSAKSRDVAEKVMGTRQYDTLKLARRMVRTSSFDLFKRSFGSEAMSTSNLPLPVTGLPPDLDFPQAHIEDSRMIITSDDLQNIFDHVIGSIESMIDRELEKLRASWPGDNASYLILSGGLCSSPYVQKRLRDWCETSGGQHPNALNLKVLVTPNPELDVVHGLIMERLEREKWRLR